MIRGTEATDVLYIPRERVAETPYRPPFVFEPVTDRSAADFHWLDEHVLLSHEALALRRGRYRFFADFSATDPAVELKVGLAAGSRPLMRYHGASGWLAQTGRHWIFDAPCAMAVSVFFDFPGLVDPSFVVNRITIERLPQFDDVQRRAWT